MVVTGDQDNLTLEVLTRFYREVALPDIERIVSRVVGDHELRINSHFAEMRKRFDRLELAMRGVAARQTPDVEP